MSARLGLVAAALFAVSAPAIARPSSPGLSPTERCVAFLDNFHGDFNHGHAVPTTALADGGCRYERVTIEIGSHVGYEIGELTVRGIDFDPTLDAGPPMSIRIDARGVVETHPGLSGAQEWMLRQTRTPFDGVADLTYDPAAKVATLHELSMTGAVVGRVELDGVVEGTDEVDDQESSRFGLRALHGRVDSRSFLPGLVMPAAIGFLADTDPASSVARGKLMATVFLTDALPRAGASPATVAAILGMVADLPRLKHPFELRLLAPGDPITPHDVEHATDGPDGVAALMAKLRIEASYAGPFTRAAP